METALKTENAPEVQAPQAASVSNGSDVGPSLRSALKATVSEMIGRWREHLAPVDWAKVCPYQLDRLPSITYDPKDVQDAGFQKMVRRELIRMASELRNALNTFEQRDALVKDLIEYLRNFKEKVITCTSEVAIPDKSDWRNCKATLLLSRKGFIIRVNGESREEEHEEWKPYHFNRMCLWTNDLVQFVWNGTNAEDIRRVLESTWRDIYFERKKEEDPSVNKTT